ncbi:MAG: hypothetical protein K0M55_19460 [Rhizobium sp.]|nr:hypothetical protein [Rhizobium sp.]
MIEEELAERQRIAVVAASQASDAVADLLRFATEGPTSSGFTFDGDVVELLLDAARVAIMVTLDERDADIFSAITARLEGWA